ncbi:phage baseplate upper protein [Niallia sp. FSL W8-1348]|uniref:phage baseplate upper protein n=1 Tax=Niallia sp. FSL W8-1348 TaxID=2954656 RepID=UPI0030F9D9E8
MEKNADLKFNISATTNQSITSNIRFSTQDEGSAKLTFFLFKDGVELPLNAVVGKLVMRMRDGSKFTDNVSIIDKVNGIAEYKLTAEQLKHYGKVTAELYLYYEEQKLSVHRFTFTILQALIDEDIPVLTEFYIDDFEELKATINSIADETTEIINTVGINVEEAKGKADEAITLIEQNQVVKLTEFNENKQQVTEQLSTMMTQTEFDSWVATLLDGGRPSIFLENPVYYPNAVYNSSFERFNEDGKPAFWDTTGIITPLEHLAGSHSLRLSQGQYAQIKDKPIQCFKWADYSTDFTLRAIGDGVIRVSVLSDGVVQPIFSYVNNQYIQRNYFDFTIDSMNWFNSKYFVELHPTNKTCVLKIEVISGTTVYIDCVSAIPITQGSKLDIQYTDGAMNYNDVMMVRTDDLLDAPVGTMWFRSDL